MSTTTSPSAACRCSTRRCTSSSPRATTSTSSARTCSIPYGGAFKVTQGLSDAYPDRVLTTPISEASLFGVAAGMALRGRRPILEIMFGDFIALGFDQVVNGISKFREMYDDQVTVPLVVRTPMGGRRGYGPTHSQSLEKLLLGVPNICVVAASECHDIGALLTDAVEDERPVFFVENKLMYGRPNRRPGGRPHRRARRARDRRRLSGAHVLGDGLHRGVGHGRHVRRHAPGRARRGDGARSSSTRSSARSSRCPSSLRSSSTPCSSRSRGRARS